MAYSGLQTSTILPKDQFPANVKHDSEANVFVEWLCMAAKMWGNDSHNTREKARLRSLAESTKEGGLAAGAEATKVSVKEGGGSAEDRTEEINSGDSSMAVALLFVERPESWAIWTKAVNHQENKQKIIVLKPFEMKTNTENRNCLEEELTLLTTLQIHAQCTHKNTSNEEHMEFWRMCKCKNHWILDTADALCC